MTIAENGSIQKALPNNMAGFVGEHKSTTLDITLPVSMAADYYRIHFQTPAGVLHSPNLSAVNRHITYALPQELTLAYGKLPMSVSGVNAEGNDIEGLVLSSVFALSILPSVGEPMEPVGEAFVSPLELAITAANSAAQTANQAAANVMAMAENGDFDGTQGSQGPAGAQGAAGADGLTVSVNSIPHSGGNVSLGAENIPIADSGGHFTAAHVEGALAELFTSVSDSKTALATDIESMGGNVGMSGSVPTFEELSDGILSISTGVTDLVGTLSFSGTYATSVYYTAAGCRMGFNAALGELYILIQGGTSSSYENIYYVVNSLPSGVSLVAQSPFRYSSAAPQLYRYAAVLSGVTGKLDVSCNLNAINATDDYVQCAITATYV